MKLLAVETATDACSAALLVEGGILERFQIAPREHTQLILPMVESLLAEAEFGLQDLDALAFGRGPGSFTGLRIAAGITQGLALGANLPVVPVSTLAAMAQHFLQDSGCSTFYTALDARMGEVYWGVYQKDAAGFVRLLGTEAVLAAADIETSAAGDEKCAGIGSGWAAYGNILNERLNGCVKTIEPNCHPHAASVAILGRDGFRTHAVSAEYALPVYLRNKVAKKKGE